MTIVDRTSLMAAMIAARVYSLGNPPIRWDKDRLAYVYSDGTVVTHKEARNTVESHNEQVLAVALLLLTGLFVDGQIDVSTWQKRVAVELKHAIIANYLIGRGAELEIADYDMLTRHISGRYTDLDRLAQSISNGEMTQAQIMASVKRFAIAAVVAYWLGMDEAARSGGFVYEQRFLGLAENCDSCIYYASLGKVSVGSLPAIGQDSECGSNCQCTKVYYRADGTSVSGG